MGDVYKQTECRDDQQFNGNIWILIAGDKGGDSTKFHFEILNSRKVGSVDKVHFFCFYKGSDLDEDIWKMFEPYCEEL